MTPQLRRCAIYTRKSSEEGLELTFNSLDAQREACEAYIKSQAHEGWKLVDAAYDDGGYSGGNLDRPGLRRLMQDIDQRRVDVIVVYKVDRLTRSLADFAKIVDVLDRQNASFVSITQQFNTTTSMGRLTLNVLLSFAQFEREVAGERIRDKIAASKRRGMWMGGNAPLGYDRRDKQLVVNESEAEVVRLIFQRYLDLGTVAQLQMDLRARGIVSKASISGRGRKRGSIPYSRGALYYLLRNQVYIGRVTHKDTSYIGQHVPILAGEIWERVQTQLKSNRSGVRTAPATANEDLLAGLLYDDRDRLMSPSFTKKKRGLRYRYYVSQAILQNDKSSAGEIARIPADIIERVVTERIQRYWAESSDKFKPWLTAQASIRDEIERVVIRQEAIEIVLRRSGQKKLTVPGVLARRGRGLDFASFEAGVAKTTRKPVLALVKAICRARYWMKLFDTGEVQSYYALARRVKMNPGYVRRTMQLAFLAPDLVEEIVSGRLHLDTGVVDLTGLDFPLSWQQQRDLLLSYSSKGGPSAVVREGLTKSCNAGVGRSLPS